MPDPRTSGAHTCPRHTPPPPTPADKCGHLSGRTKPTAGILDVVEPLYAQVRAHERTLEAAGTPRKEVVAAGLELLVELIGIERGGGDEDAEANVRLLLTASARSASTLDAKLAIAQQLIDDLGLAVEAVTQKLQMLDALRVGGDVEAAHLAEAERFRVLFAQIRTEVDGAAADLKHLAGLADHAASASAGRRLVRLADQTVSHIA